MAAISRRWRGGRIIIIRVRASRCGESALNPPTSPPIPRRRSAPAPAQRHALPEHFLTPFPRTSAPPRSDDAHPQAAPCIPRRPHNTFPAEGRRPPPHSDAHCPSPPATSPQPRRTPAGCAMHSSPTSQHIPRRRPSLAPAQRRTPAGCATHTRRPHNTFPTEDLLPPPHSDAPCPSTFAPPRSPDARPPTPQPIPRSAALPPPPFRFGHKKNGTAQWMCDAECLGRPSLRSVIGVGEPRAVRRRCGALAWRVGLRPQPWALRSRRCGRVLRA